MTPRRMILVWLALLLLFGANLAGAYYLPLGNANIALALGIAVLQIALVVALFMKLRWAASLMRVCAAAGLFWLLVMIGLMTTDYLTRTAFPPSFLAPVK